MYRVLRSGRFIVLVVASVLAGVAAIMNASPPSPVESEQPSTQCDDCDGPGAIYIPPSDDPQVTHEHLEAAKAKVDAKVQAELRVLQDDHRKVFNGWYGTAIGVATTVNDANRKQCEAIAGYFANDPPAPDERKRVFERYLRVDSKFRCVRWDAMVLSARPNDNDNGWEATIRVRPYLMQAAGRSVFTPLSTIETWQVSKDGEVTPMTVDVETGSVNMLFID